MFVLARRLEDGEAYGEHILCGQYMLVTVMTRRRWDISAIG